MKDASRERVRADAHERQERGTRQLLVGRICFLVAGYVVAIVLARALGPARYGVYGVVVSLLTWITMLASAGVASATSKLMPEQRDDAPGVESSARALALLAALVVFGVCWLLAPAIARAINIPDGARLLRIALLEIPLQGIVVGSTGILLGHRRFGPLGISIALFGLAKVVGVLLLLVIGMTLEGALIVNVASTGIVAAYLVARVPLRTLLPRPELLRLLVEAALPLGLYLIALQIVSSVDLWLLSRLGSGAEETGYYVAALNLARTLRVIPAVQSSILFASLAWALSRSDWLMARNHVQAASRFASLIVFPVAVLLSLDAGEVMGVLFSAPYAAGGRFLVLHLVAFGLFAFMDAFFQGVMAAGSRVRAALTLLGLIPVAVALNFVLIPRFGAMGAAASLLGVELVGAGLAGWLAWRRFGPLARANSIARIVAATAAVAAISALIPLQGVWVLVKIGVLGILYLGALRWMGEVTAADLALVRR